MDIKILGKVPSGITTTMVEAFLKYKQVPDAFQNLPTFYKLHGEKYGVRWDFAVFQSCLETNWFRFGGDVKSGQNNFAGIGATGGGVAGESYESKSKGVLSQIQVLAIRPGVPIPKDEMVSERYRKNYDVVFGKQKTWGDLAGTWAADKKYWDKIQSIAREFRTFSGVDPLVEYSEPSSDASQITWWEFNRTDDGRPCVTGYNAGQPLTNIWGGKVDDLIDALQSAYNAETFRVAPTNSKVIPDAPEWPVVKSAQNGGSEEPTPRPPQGEPGQKLAWIPFATRYGKIPTKGQYPGGHPEGAIVHHTAGHPNARGTVDYLAKQPYPCLVIGPDGEILQPFPLSEWGWHDGTEYSRRCVGIEVTGWGKLDKKGDEFFSWAGYKIPANRVRHIPTKNGNQQVGYYEKWTQEQEESLINLLVWLARNWEGFKVDLILGHDETAPSRKNDPGGSMSMTMAQLRAKVKSLI